MIRAMRADDLPQVALIERASFTDPWTEEMFATGLDLPVALHYVYEEAGEVVGYLIGTALFEQAEIANVATHPSHRKKGLAKALMDVFEREVKTRGAEECFLEVRVGNLPALALYHGNGYEKVSVRKKYYPDGEDAFVMKKTL
ncbi:MAG: ribosomal protein S18-alanine N-acetyltransferase [Clostridia bacterium]|nr:ribosomal protein S18-alanine N-acetyltransferase [Clostridia bacterium]